MGIVHTVETVYNFDSIVEPEELMKACHARAVEAVVLSDRNKLHAMVDMEEFGRKYKVKVIHGFRTDLKVREHFYEILLVALTDKGIENLISLCSACHVKGGSPYLEPDNLMDGIEGIAGILSFNGKTNEDLPLYGNAISGLQKILGQENVFIELHLSSAEDENRAKAVGWLSSKFHVPIFASNRVSFLKEEDAYVREVRAAIKEGRQASDVFCKGRYLKSEQEMMELYGAYPFAVENGMILAKRASARLCLKGDADFAMKPLLFPVPEHTEIPEDLAHRFTPMKEYVLPASREKLLPIAYLVQLAYEGFESHYESSDREALDRLKMELGVIISENFTHIMLVVWDFIRYCRQEGIALGPGRGSAAGSLLARCLGIIQIDPLAYGLIFERFLNPERVTLPDIDIDLSSEKRHLVIQYAQSKYGPRSVSQIITFGKFGEKKAMESVSKALGVPDGLIKQAAKLMPKKGGKDSGALSNLAEKEPLLKKVLSIVSVISDLPSHSSKNAAGIILTNEDLSLQVPVTQAFDHEGNAIFLTQIPNNRGQMEKLGYAKIDFLGLKNVDMESKVERWIQKNHGLARVQVSVEDAATYKLYQSGRLTGVFQMDSSGMQNTCIDVQPESIHELMDILALYRPGPMKEIKTYVANKRKKKSGDGYLAAKGMEILQPVLEQTHGIMVYQEQIILIASMWAGYTLGQADLLRQAISKKDKQKMAQEKERFLRLSKEKGRDEGLTEKLYQSIYGFSQYGYNKSHAAVYAYQSFQNAYHKTHFPAEYMAVRISESMSDRENAAVYLTEAIRMGLCVNKPDIRHSETEFIPTADGIVFGLPMVKEIGLSAAHAVVKARKEAPYLSFDDFLSRGVLQPAAIAALVKSGAFDAFGSRKEMLARLSGEKKAVDYRVHALSDLPWAQFREGTRGEDFSDAEKREMEKEYLGYSFTKHPLMEKKENLDEMIRTKSYGQWVYGVVGQVRKKKDKNKKEMADLVIDRLEGELSVVVFHSEWAKAKDVIQKGDTVLCRIKLENEWKAIANEIERV